MRKCLTYNMIDFILTFFTSFSKRITEDLSNIQSPTFIYRYKMLFKESPGHIGSEHEERGREYLVLNKNGNFI